MNDLLDPVYEEGRKAGLAAAVSIVAAKHSQLIVAQRKSFNGRRDLSIGILAQIIKSLRKARKQSQ